MKSLKIEWDDIYAGVFLIFCIIAFILLSLFVIADKKVRAYYLSGDVKNGLVIYGDIDWDQDIAIAIDRNISYQEAIQLVKELNCTLDAK